MAYISSNTRRGGTSPPRRVFDRCYRVLDHTVRLRSDVSRVGALVNGYMAPFRTGDADGGPTYFVTYRGGKAPFVLYRDGRRIQSAPTYPDLLDLVFAAVHQDAIERTTRYLAVHASAASWRGRGFVFPAPMDSGKTTLVAGLVRAGFRYLSDEAALFDLSTTRLHPFPKVLWMEAPSVRAFPDLQSKLAPEFRDLSRMRSYVRPGDLRPRATGGPCRLGFVIAPAYRKGEVTRLEPISRSEALVILVQNSFNLRRIGGRGLEVLGEAVGQARCYRLLMGDVDSAVAEVQELAGAR